MNKKDSILITYPPGGYGTFVEWALSYFSGDLTDESLPFRPSGSSHGYIGKPLDFGELSYFSLSSDKYFSSDLNFKFVRCHCLRNVGNYNFIESYINKYKTCVNYVINIYDDPNSTLLIFHNIINKIRPDLRKKYLDDVQNLTKITESDSLWEVREKYSFYLGVLYTTLSNRWLYPTDDDKIIKLSVTELVADFSKCLKMIFEKTGLRFDPTRAQILDDIILKWLELQKFINMQKLCEDIVHNVVNCTDFSWSPGQLTIYDEAFIQMLLRDLHGIELRCYNLNEFPTNSHDLRKLVINA